MNLLSIRRHHYKMFLRHICIIYACSIFVVRKHVAGLFAILSEFKEILKILLLFSCCTRKYLMVCAEKEAIKVQVISIHVNVNQMLSRVWKKVTRPTYGAKPCLQNKPHTTSNIPSMLCSLSAKQT